MGQKFDQLNERHKTFIDQQKLFFVASADVDGYVNVSPKGMDSLRIPGDKRVLWLNVTGSGNESSAHVQAVPRMTIMFCAFEGRPMILRIYGKASVIHTGDEDWEELSALLPALPGARQVFDLEVELVQTSCGMAVPYFDFVANRDLLENWAIKKGDAGIRQYWLDKNQLSLDGKNTNIRARAMLEDPTG